MGRGKHLQGTDGLGLVTQVAQDRDQGRRKHRPRREGAPRWKWRLPERGQQWAGRGSTDSGERGSTRWQSKGGTDDSGKGRSGSGEDGAK